MAEECSKSPATSEIINTDEGNSAGKPRSSRSGRTPHYLRAPVGSCHEHCKYGGPQTFKTKPINPIRGKTTRKLPDELLLAEDVVAPGLARQPTNKLRILSNLECQTSDIANVGKQGGPAPDHARVQFNAKGKKKSEAELKSSRSSKTHFSYLRKKVKPGMASSGTKQFSPGASAMFSSETYSRSTKMKREPLEAEPMSLPDSSGDSSHRKKNNITTRQYTRTSIVAAKNQSVSLTTSNSLEFSSRSPSMRPRKGIASKVMSPLKNQNKNRNSTKNAEVVQIAKEVVVQEKTLYVIDEETEHIPSEFTSTTTTFVGDDQNGSAAKMSPDQSLLLPQHLSLPKYPSPKSQEHEPSDYPDNEGEGCSYSGHGESDSLVQSGTSQRPTQDRTNSAKNETCKAVNLSLRKGKVVVGTQAESSSPRRPKNRRGRAFEENQNPKADARRRTFKRREEIEGGKNSSTPRSVKVTLKHQDVREKKEGRGLFNNMIEETASELVKTRKSKVKALVGAFETVISLQETK
ncbi:uncharacterized protein LOC115727643 [Rhodamnia argentea]|uniref:Uncharacterized protein LOC115727643 n=1 Tax=Rhodamnia argentea TaxID=178133 RepID=A0A8B8MUI2_9MYRT|nr:uncharacterized protein LOC115727643 [Rhodamnia argentea]XP_048128527.1 uncharacterized protein LOC115727643 [Rhodamnia argentea]XP_048128528.1 uncharacterized protein LOC115727643 [Rhodamnia argentea]XP_048128529.1 uncharacterized protein LOC115727643 [Rhodamnia argentea]